MKKLLITCALILAIASSMVAGTLAVYTKTLEPVSGTISAKQFFIGTNETAFPDIKLAPKEKTQWNFSVVNFKDNNVTEVDMDMKIDLSVAANNGKQAIDGLTVGMYDSAGNQLGASIIKNGQTSFSSDRACLANEKATRNFVLKAEWVDGVAGDTIDTANAMNANSTKISVTVTGIQH